MIDLELFIDSRRPEICVHKTNGFFHMAGKNLRNARTYESAAAARLYGREHYGLHSVGSRKKQPLNQFDEFFVRVLANTAVAHFCERQAGARTDEFQGYSLFTDDDIDFVGHISSPESQSVGTAARTGTFKNISTSSGVRKE